VRSGETTIWGRISEIPRIYCRNEVRRSNPQAIVAALESALDRDTSARNKAQRLIVRRHHRRLVP
jgi:hypothetical protein